MTANQIAYQANKIKEAENLIKEKEAKTKQQEADVRAQKVLLDTSSHIYEYGDVMTPKILFGTLGKTSNAYRSQPGYVTASSQYPGMKTMVDASKIWSNVIGAVTGIAKAAF